MTGGWNRGLSWSHSAFSLLFYSSVPTHPNHAKAGHRARLQVILRLLPWFQFPLGSFLLK